MDRNVRTNHTPGAFLEWPKELATSSGALKKFEDDQDTLSLIEAWARHDPLVHHILTNSFIGKWSQERLVRAVMFALYEDRKRMQELMIKREERSCEPMFRVGDVEDGENLKKLLRKERVRLRKEQLKRILG